MEKNHNGRWTQAEHDMFLQGLQIYGKNWKKIEQMIGTRTGCQIRSHAQKFFLRHKEKLCVEDLYNQSEHKQSDDKVMAIEQHLSADGQSSNHYDNDTEISYLQIQLNRFNKQKGRNGQLQNQLLNFWNNYIDIPIKSSMRKASIDSSNSETIQHVTQKTHSFIPFGRSGNYLKDQIEKFRGLG